MRRKRLQPVRLVQPSPCGIGRGQRVSLIQFGSRTDVYLPANVKIRIKLGDHVIGGETVLAVVE